jgi:hypothetical protein
MLRPHGFGQIIGDPAHAHGMAEHDAVNCIHCGSISMVKSSTTGKLEVMVYRSDGTHYFKEAGFCRSCMAPICPRCDGKPCDNRFRRMDRQERSGTVLPFRK